MQPKMMMRESVSHPPSPQTPPQTPPQTTQTPPKNTHSNRPHRSVLHWPVLVSIATLTVLTGIAVLIAFMSPENLRSAPTIALVCVLVLLCVPIPVLMLERSHHKTATAEAQRQSTKQTQPHQPHQPRQAVLHPSHQPHDSNPDTHRPPRTTTAPAHSGISITLNIQKT